MLSSSSASAVIEVKNLYFSYEVAQNINSTVKRLVTDESAHGADERKTTRDGGLSLDLPRRQHEAREEIVYKIQLRDISLELPRGARCLMTGSNGSGKSTLLNILGGKHMVSNGDVCVLSRKAFEDTALANEVALLTGNWTRTVAFVGHGVPYQAMAVQTLIDSHSVGVDPARLEELIALLGVKRGWNLTAASDGQRRRVQILLKLLRPFKVLLLDEITTDLDLIVRQDLLAWLKKECDDKAVTVVYCTHIFDGLDGWATHICHIEQTRLRTNAEVGAVPELAVHSAPAAPADGRAAGILFRAIQGWLLEARPDFAALLSAADGRRAAPSAARAPLADAGAHAIDVRALRWSYAPPAGVRGAPTLPPALDGVDVQIAHGERVLLTGANGAGKSSLLRILGGKHMVSAGSVRILGRDAFADVQTLNTRVALLTGDWSRTVACVGSGVPYQADFEAGFMAANALSALKAEKMYDDVLLDARLARLTAALDLDPTWRMNAVSDGQRRRIQILLKLLRPCDIYLMDEVTTDLDLLARQSLLSFLKEESETRGVSVVYATHILDGLDGWPTKLLHVSAGKVVHYGHAEDLALAAADAAQPRARESGSLYRTVRARLRSELEAEGKAAMAAPPPVANVEAAPSTCAAMDVEPPAKPVVSMFASSGGSRFDRFGGAGRQVNMYG